MNTDHFQNINVGVDTGKFQLDIYIRPLDIYFTVSNDEKGIKEAINKKTSFRYCYEVPHKKANTTYITFISKRINGFHD